MKGVFTFNYRIHHLKLTSVLCYWNVVEPSEWDLAGGLRVPEVYSGRELQDPGLLLTFFASGHEVSGFTALITSNCLKYLSKETQICHTNRG